MTYEENLLSYLMFNLIIGLILIILPDSVALAKPKIWLKVRERYNKVNTIQGLFQQRVCSEIDGTCQEFQGRFYAMRPNLLRVEVQKPEEQLIIADGESLTILVKNKVLAKSPLIETSPLLLLFSTQKDSFFVKQEKSASGRIHLVLTPVDTSYYSIQFGVNPKSLLIEEIRFEDWEGNKTEIILSKVIINKKLAKKLFQRAKWDASPK